MTCRILKCVPTLVPAPRCDEVGEYLNILSLLYFKHFALLCDNQLLSFVLKRSLKTNCALVF